VLVEHGSDDPEAAAEALASMPAQLEDARANVKALEAELALALVHAKVPPARPARVFDGGCVRQDPGDPTKLWLLSKLHCSEVRARWRPE
jgi:hypothetical protein